MDKTIKKSLKLFLGVLSMFTGAGVAHSEVSLSGKHIVMVNAGVDSVVGQYLFWVDNKNSEAVAAKIPVMLPKEVSDFAPFRGAANDELTLDANGNLILDKEFEPGVTSTVINFKADGAFGKVELNFIPSAEVDFFNIVTNDLDMDLKSDLLQDGVTSMFKPDQTKGLITEEGSTIASGKTITISIANLPEGRIWFWILGASATILLCILAALLAIRTRPAAGAPHDDAVQVAAVG